MEVHKQFLFIGDIDSCRNIANALGLTRSHFRHARCEDDLRGITPNWTIICVGTWYFRWQGIRDVALEQLALLKERGVHIIEAGEW